MRWLRGQHAHLLAALVAALAVGAVAAADTVVLVGTNIPLRNCQIQRARGGELFYLDAGGQRRRRPLEDVRSIGFDGLPELDAAEAAFAAGDLETAIRKLLRAVIKTEKDQAGMRRMWVHVRLARLHDRRGEFVQSVRHAAAVWLLDDDPYWRVLEPLSDLTPDDPEQPPFAAAFEAMDLLRQAGRKVRQPTMARLIDTLTAQVRPIYDALARSYRGSAMVPGATISGISREKILAGDGTAPAAAPVRPGRDAGPEPMTDPGSVPAPVVVTAPPDAEGERIESLLSEGLFADAVAACEGVATRPRRRDLDRFLHQYGRALRGVGRQPDAAVMFMRCAILFPESAWTPVSLIETAEIYDEHYRNRAAARRLLTRAGPADAVLVRPGLSARAARLRERLGRNEETP